MLSVLIDALPTWVGPIAVMVVGIGGALLFATYLLAGWRATAPNSDNENDRTPVRHTTSP